MNPTGTTPATASTPPSPREAPPVSPTLRRRLLASALKELRLDAGLTHGDVADRLGWPQAKVSKIEGAKQAASVEAVMALAEVYGAPAERRERLVELARTARTRAWWSAYADVLSADQALYVGLEAEARAVWTFGVEAVPELLQTSDYAQAVLRSRSDEVSRAERKLQLLLDRQRGLVQGGVLELNAVLAESALRRATGAPGVLRGQLEHLRDLARRPSVTVRVLPFSAGAVPAEGPFTVLGFAGSGHPDVAFVSSPVNRTLFEDPSAVESFRRAVHDLESAALAPGESQRFIERLVEEVNG